MDGFFRIVDAVFSLFISWFAYVSVMLACFFNYLFTLVAVSESEGLALSSVCVVSLFFDFSFFGRKVVLICLWEG